MVQVDVFWGYGLGASLAAMAGRQIAREPQPLHGEYFAKTMVFLSVFWAPTGLLLLLRHPSWETMQVAPDFAALPHWLVLAFGITNVTQGILGFYTGAALLRRERPYLAQLNWLLGYYGMFFILLYGWDGLGYDRFLYDRDLVPGSPAWTPGAGTAVGVAAALWRFVARSTVARTLYLDGVWLLPALALLGIDWMRRNGARASAATLCARHLGAVFLVGLGAAALSALVVRSVASALHAHVLSYFIGLPLSWLLLYGALRPGRPGHRFVMGLTR